MVSPIPITEETLDKVVEAVDEALGQAVEEAEKIRTLNVGDLERKLEIPDLPELPESLQNEIKTVDEEGNPIIYRGVLSKLRYANTVNGIPYWVKGRFSLEKFQIVSKKKRRLSREWPYVETFVEPVEVMLRELRYPYLLHLVTLSSEDYFEHLRGLGVESRTGLSEELINGVFAPLNEQLFDYLSRARQVYRDAGIKFSRVGI